MNYDEVSNGNEGFSVVTRVRGGSHSQIESVIIILKNRNSKYLIKGVPDLFGCVSYRSEPLGCIGRRIFNESMQKKDLLLETYMDSNR